MRSDRSYYFDHPPEVVWAAIARVDAYRSWWPWLRRFEAAGLDRGDCWACTVRPPLPYVLRFSVSIDEVERPHRIAATVSGDIGGDAELTLAPTPDGCLVRLTSSLEPTGQPLRGLLRMAPWAAGFGHDWVLDTGLRQFRGAL